LHFFNPIAITTKSTLVSILNCSAPIFHCCSPRINLSTMLTLPTPFRNKFLHGFITRIQNKVPDGHRMFRLKRNAINM
jgi:hypothetical protein